MREGTLADSGLLDRQESAPTASILNDSRTVELDPVSMLVSKQFRSPNAAGNAQREFDYLRRFSAALAGQPILRCPEPVRVDPKQGKVWMTFCPGEQLHHLAETSSTIDDDLEHIAGQIVIALEKYVAEFNEPFYDLAAWNMLYHTPTRTLSLIDFAGAGRDWLRHPDFQDAPVDVSLGCLVGTTVYHTVRARRASWRKRDYWKRQERLMGEVLAQMDSRHSLRLPIIRQVSHMMYDVMGKQRGRPRRRLWFWTAGQALFNRRSNALIARATQYRVARMRSDA